jgi:5-methyltetrahydropteroyltriglutamate--homocysteine methyltransferase
MFPTTIAGSLPKPSWLAEPNKLWPQWRLAGDELAAGKLDATLLSLKLQEDAGIDVVTDGEQSRQHFVHGFLEYVDGIDFDHKVEMGIRNDRYKAMVPTVTGALKLKGRVHGPEARHARAHTARKLKITMPGPMTIVDTIADRHYGDRTTMAFAFADLLNAEARALEADGVDVIQFDEPAFNVYMAEVKSWGVEALHRAIDGLQCATAVHICYGYGIKANIDWKATLGGEWRQYEEIFPALAASRRHRHDRNAPGRRLDHRGGAGSRPEGTHHRRHQLRHGADAARHRRSQTRGARQGRGAGAPALRLTASTARPPGLAQPSDRAMFRRQSAQPRLTSRRCAPWPQCLPAIRRSVLRRRFRSRGLHARGTRSGRRAARILDAAVGVAGLGLVAFGERSKRAVRRLALLLQAVRRALARRGRFCALGKGTAGEGEGRDHERGSN